MSGKPKSVGDRISKALDEGKAIIVVSGPGEVEGSSNVEVIRR